MTHPQVRSSVWKDLDRLLRGEATTLAALTRGDIEIESARLPPLLIGLGAFYGICMGCFALTNKEFSSALSQTLSSMGKVPILFFATLVVSFPSLYVFNALVGSRLSLASLWRLLVSALTVMMTVLASLGPVVAFFSLSTDNYPFIVLLNVTVFGLSGFLGLKFLVGTLHRLTTVLYDREATFEAAQSAIESHNANRETGATRAHRAPHQPQRQTGICPLGGGFCPRGNANVVGVAPLHCLTGPAVPRCVAAPLELLRCRVQPTLQRLDIPAQKDCTRPTSEFALSTDE